LKCQSGTVTYSKENSQAEENEHTELKENLKKARTQQKPHSANPEQEAQEEWAE
jgi:hypothetical protein